MDTIKLLRFVVSAKGVVRDIDEVKVISETPTQRNIKEVHGFLGASGYFRHNIEGYTTMAAPLISLTRKGSKFE